MRETMVFSLLILFFSQAAAGVYRSIGPDGKVQYTDRPISGAEEVLLPQTNQQTVESPDQQSPKRAADKGPYEAFEIALPEPGSTIRTGTGEVQVSLILAPGLIVGHSIRIAVDGNLIPGKIPGTQATLNDVTLGSHSLQAQILDDADVPVASTESVTFHMRKPLPESMLP
jgi:hypothetical protein